MIYVRFLMMMILKIYERFYVIYVCFIDTLCTLVSRLCYYIFTDTGDGHSDEKNGTDLLYIGLNYMVYDLKIYIYVYTLLPGDWTPR